MKVLTVICLMVCSICDLVAQCIPTTSSTFGLPAVTCPEDNLNFINPHAAGFAYEWDLCSKDMEVTPQVNYVATMIANYGLVQSYLMEENGEFFLFLLVFNLSRFFRIDLGNRPDNEPQQIHDFGNLGLLANPLSLDFIKDESSGIWYGITCNSNGNQFIRFTFGTSIKNTPIASYMGSLAPLYSNIRACKVMKEANNYFLITMGLSNNAVAVVNLGSSLNNNFSTANIVTNITFSSLVLPISLDVIQDCGVWNAVVTSQGINRHLIFTNGLSNLPIIIDENLPSGFGLPTHNALCREGSNYYAFTVDINGRAVMSYYGNSITNNNYVNYDLGTISSELGFNALYGSNLFFLKGKWIIWVGGYFSNKLFRIEFERKCGQNVSYTNAYNPTNIRYRKVGTHPVTLQIKDNMGNVLHVYTGNVNINPTTTVADFTANDVCIGSPVIFNNTSVGSDSNVLAWQWNFGDSNTSSLKNPPPYTYASPGSYNVTLTVYNQNGCVNSITKVVRVSGGVTADFQAPATACVGQTITFNNLSTYTNVPFHAATGFYWSFGDGTYSPFQNPTKIYNTAGIYNITLTVQDSAGCSNTITKSIEILENPTVSFSFPLNICAGEPVQFISAASNATEYLWFFEGHGTSTQPNPTVVFQQGGFYDVILQVKNANNCINTYTVENIQVFEKPAIIFTTQRFFDNPLRIQFNNFTTGANTYEWNFGDENTSTEAQPVHTYAQAGEYVVSLKAISPNNCESNFSQVIGVGTLKPNVSLSNLSFVDNQIQITLKNKGNTLLNNLQIFVIVADTTFREIYAGTLGKGEAVDYTLQTLVPIELLAKAKYFCVKVLPKPSVQDVDLSDNEQCYNLTNRLFVYEPYPNPTQDKVTFAFTAPNKGTITVRFTDVLGKSIIKTFWISEGYNQEVMDVRFLAKGVYIVSFEFEGNILHKKLVIN